MQTPAPPTQSMIFVPWKKEKLRVHLDAVGMSFLRSPYVGMYRLIGIPRASFRSRMSHLLRKRISCTYMAWHGTGGHQFLPVITLRNDRRLKDGWRFTLLRSFDLQTAVHKLTLSSNWLIPESSPSSLSSKTDMGARKIIALASMKYGCHTPRFRRLSAKRREYIYVTVLTSDRDPTS